MYAYVQFKTNCDKIQSEWWESRKFNKFARVEEILERVLKYQTHGCL